MSVRRTIDCVTCGSRSSSEWGSLCAADAGLLSRAKIVNRYAPRQTIFYQGNPPMGLYCVESGRVLLRKTDQEGRSVIVRLIGPGQTLGYRAFFSGQPYSASAEAATECTICWVDKHVVQDIIERNPMLLASFLQHVAKDLKEAEEHQLQSVTLPVRARLAHFLLALKDQDGEVDDEGRIILQLDLSRQDIAAVLGTTPETVARTVRSLTDEGVARFKRRQVIIDDLDLLLDEVEPAI